MLNVPYATDPGDHATDGETHIFKLRSFKIIFIHIEGRYNRIIYLKLFKIEIYGVLF